MGVSNTTGGVTTLKTAVDGSGNFAAQASLVAGGVATNAGAGTVSYGATTATSASTGANGAVPAQVVGYIIINVGGTAMKMPYFNT